MPIIDDNRDVLVVRIVYDGAPMSGKTTSLRALGTGLGVEVTTPQEADGRTLFFDWLDYVGGLYEGRQIRCQVISVPGQDELAERRQELLAQADAVVFVADTRQKEVARATEGLRQLVPHCRGQSPPVGLVIQANKRDAPDRMERDALYSAFGEVAPVAIVDTVATTGEGIREAFVLSVRLALDRVRALAEAGQLPHGRPDVDSPDDLLARLRALGGSTPVNEVVTVRPKSCRPQSAVSVAVETGSTTAGPEDETCPTPGRDARPASVAERSDGAASVAMEPAVRRNSAATAELVEAPFVPDPMMPGGFIWPPVDGRVLLHEVSQQGVVPVRSAKGDWRASCRGVLFHSSAQALFPHADAGRQALIDWARIHSTHVRRLSEGRTVILAEAGGGHYRLWQLLRTEATLRERLLERMQDASPDALAEALRQAALHLLEAREGLHCDKLRLPITLWTVSGDLRAQPRFVGLMPSAEPQSEEPSGRQLVVREFAPLLHQLVRQRGDHPLVREALYMMGRGTHDCEASAALAEIAAAGPAGGADLDVSRTA